MKMVYTHQVTLALDLLVEPVVMIHNILADTRQNRAGILRRHPESIPSNCTETRGLDSRA